MCLCLKAKNILLRSTEKLVTRVVFDPSSYFPNKNKTEKAVSLFCKCVIYALVKLKVYLTITPAASL